MNHIYAIGEAIIDFSKRKTGEYVPQPGGAVANVSAAVAILGGKATLISAVGNDQFGDLLINTLKEVNVDTSLVHRSNRQTMLAFVSLLDNGERQFSFYRKYTAEGFLPDVSDKVIFDHDILHFGSVCLNTTHNIRVHEKLIQKNKEAGGIVCFDPNIRLNIWKDHKKMYQVINYFLNMVDLLKVSEEELELIMPNLSEESAINSLLEMGIQTIFVTRGSLGASVYTREGNADVPGYGSKTIDTTGAGDAFVGSILYKLQLIEEPLNSINLEKWAKIVSFACEKASKSTTEYGAIPSYKTFHN